MIPVREIMCPVCGELFTEACYGSSRNRERLLLNHRGLPGLYTYSLTAMNPPSPKSKSSPSVAKAVYTLEEGSLDGTVTTPDIIRVRKDDDDDIYEFRRCCPHCSVLTELPVGWGKLPSYVVVTLGLSGEGKSSLLQVLDRVENQRALAQCQPHICLDTPELNLGKDVLMEVTGVDSPGATNVVTIRTPSGRPIANVLFRDVAGEIFSQRRLSDYKVYNFFRAHGSYPGPDAFMLVHSATQTQELLMQVYNYINNLLSGLHQPWPLTACVITHLDQITGENVWRHSNSAGKPLVVLDEKTFPSFNGQLPHHGYYSKDRLINRMVLQNSLVRSHYSLLDPSMKRLPHARGFLVKSCVGSGETTADFTEPINALDPFLWLLNSLRLVSIK